MQLVKKRMVPVVALIVALALGGAIWAINQDTGPGEGFISGNGRIEATEIDIATKLAGRVTEVLVQEGDFVKAGDPLAVMQTDVLEAQLNEAKAKHQQAIAAEVSAKAQIALRESDWEAAKSTVIQRESELDNSKRRLARSSVLSKKGAMAVQTFDDDETRTEGNRAAVASAKAHVAVAEAAIAAAQAEALGAEATVKAAEATVARIEADIKDCRLVAPRAGRIQYKVAEPGEVLPAGGKVMNLVDLSDVYMTFFLPEEAAGKVGLGDDVRIVLDAAPGVVIPAKVSFVASVAQFTPKSVETQVERQKLMFRVKGQIDKTLLLKHLNLVKTGLPGVAWVRLDPSVAWPESLLVKVE